MTDEEAPRVPVQQLYETVRAEAEALRFRHARSKGADDPMQMGRFLAMVTGEISDQTKAVLTTAGQSPFARGPTDIETLTVIRAFIKRARESIEVIKGSGGNTARSDAEIAVLTPYLPAQLTDEVLRPLIIDAVERVIVAIKAAEDPRRLKPVAMVMKELKIAHEGAFEPARAFEIIKEELASRT